MNDDELARLHSYLRIPSISALAEHASDMEAAVAFMEGELRDAGAATVEVLRTGGHPFLIAPVAATVDDPTRARTVLVYGHYDVQPVGDPDRWDSPAFEPTERDGYLYARGASDNKGNFFQILCAVRRLHESGDLPVNVIFLVDGEEESGGDSAIRWVEAMDPVADVAVIWDGGMVNRGLAAVECGVRGLIYRRVTVRCGTRDGHSGLFGGAAMNACHVISDVLAAVRPRAGRVPETLAVGATPVPDDLVAEWERLSDGPTMLAEAGLVPADADAAAELARRTMVLPSVDVNAVWAGEADAVKTVIPTVAHAMVSMRVAPGQDAAAMARAFDEILRAACPDGAEIDVEDMGVADPGVMDPDHPAMRAAMAAIGEATGLPVIAMRTGGTLPIFASMTGRGMPTILTGFTLPDDAIHSPNERMLIANLGTGVRAAMAMLQAFAE